MRPTLTRSILWILPGLLSLLLVPLVAARPSESAAPNRPLLTPTLSPTLTATPCPQPTPEPLWVEPITSPTNLLIQTITVRIGNGDAVTVTTESGVFAVTGNFNTYGNPALVTMTLLANITHHLSVDAHVRPISS